MSLPPHFNLLKEYRNEVFVETGSYRGDAIEQALDAGFRKILSFDNDARNIFFCRNRFDLFNEKNPLRRMITLVHGDTAHALLDPIMEIDKRMTFWLDAHWQMLEGTEPGKNPFPLLDELEQIARHPINDHTIIIDDCLIMQWNIVGYDLNLIKTRIEKINPKYKFTMHSNPVINGIMAATVK